MRLAMSLLALTTLTVPLAAAHIVVCTYDEANDRCVVTTVGDPDLPPHGAVFELPCFCVHPPPDVHARAGLPGYALP